MIRPRMVVWAHREASGHRLGLLPMLLLVGACESQVYNRGALWLGVSDSGSDAAITGDLGETDSRRPGGTGGHSGQVFGTGGSNAADAGDPDPVNGSGGTGAGPAIETGGAAPAAETGGGTVEVPSTGGQGTQVDGGAGGKTVGTGGAGTGGGSTGGGSTRGASTGGASTGGASTGGSGTGGVPADATNYNFESSAQGWGTAAGQGTITQIGRSTAQHFAGGASLAGTISAIAGTIYVLEIAPPSPAVLGGQVVTFHVFVPTSPMLNFVQPYVMEGGTFKFTGTGVTSANLRRNAWNTITVTVPSGSASIIRLGVQFSSSGTWTDTVYIDSIDW